MTTDASFVEHIQTQSGWGSELSYRRMFGEYALYLHGKVVAFACDNQLYVKPTDAGRSLLGKVSEHPPYPGAKLYFRIDDETEDRDLLRQLFLVTARALPLPKPKAEPPPRAKPSPKAKPTRAPPYFIARKSMQPSPPQPIKLYRHPLSGHSHRAEMFLRLLGLPIELIDVDLVAGEQRLPTFLHLNRFGQVPVIDDGGTVVADANAVLTYLALRYGPEHWSPREPVQAARVQQWLSQAAGALSRGAATARAINVFRIPRDNQAAVQEAHWLFAHADAALAESGAPWLAGGALPTIADIAMYTYTAHAPEGDISLDAYPALRAWLGRVEALPGFTPMAVSKVGLRTGTAAA